MGRRRAERIMGRLSSREQRLLDRDGMRDKRGAVFRAIVVVVLLVLLGFFLIPYFLG